MLRAIFALFLLVPTVACAQEFAPGGIVDMTGASTVRLSSKNMTLDGQPFTGIPTITPAALSAAIEAMPTADPGTGCWRAVGPFELAPPATTPTAAGTPLGMILCH